MAELIRVHRAKAQKKALLIELTGLSIEFCLLAISRALVSDARFDGPFSK